MTSDAQQGGACASAGNAASIQAVNLLTDHGARESHLHRWRAVSTCCWRTIGFCITLGAIATCAARLHAAPESDATSSRAARDEATRAIPWRAIAPADRSRAQFVVQNTSLYRRLPSRVIDCDPAMFAFLIAHPEVVIDVWQLMGISRITMDKLPDGTYRGTDGAGTTGNVRYLHSSVNPDGSVLAVVYADGAYDGKPFVTTLKAQSVLVLRASAVQETNGRQYMTVRVDSFVHVQQMGLQLIAKTVQPWLNKTADQNFIETLTFISNFSRTAEKNPQGMQRLATRLRSIDEPTRNELVQLCFRAADRYAQRENVQRTSGDVFARRDVAVNYSR